MSLYFSIKNKITIDDLFIVLRDSSSEYDTEKINVINENLFKLNEYFSKITEISMFSLYGDRKKITKILNQIFESQIKLDAHPLYKQRITAIYNEKIFVLALLVDDDSFLLRPINQESILITLTRILQDITNKVIICPFEESIGHQWWDEQSPYKQSHFKPIDLVIRKRDHSRIKSNTVLFDENLITKEYTSSYKTNLRITNNYTKYSSFIKKNKGLNILQNEIDKIRSRISEKIYNYEVEALSKRSSLQPIKLNEIFKTILNTNVKIDKLDFVFKWHGQNNEIINHAEKEINKYILELVKKCTSEKYFFFFSSHSNANLFNLGDIMSSLMNVLLNSLVITFQNNYTKIELKRNFLKDFKDYFEALLKKAEIDATSFEQKTYQENFENYFSRNWCDLKAILNNVIEKFNDKSKSLNQKFKDMFKELINECKEKNEILIQKTQFNIIRDEGGNIKNINITFTKDNLVLNSEILKLDKNSELDNVEIVAIYPTKNESNQLIILKFKENYNFYVHSIGNVLKKGAKISLKRFYFTYCALKEIGLFYDYEFRRLICVNIDEYGKYTEGNIKDDNLIKNEKIISSAFIEKGSKIVLVTNQSKIYKFDYEHRTMEEMIRKINNESGIQIQKLKPSDPLDNYIEAASNFEDDMFLLRSLKSIDFYNINLQLLQTIQLKEECIGIKYFTDKIDSFLVVFYKSIKSEAYFFDGLGSTTELHKNIKNEEIILGNPLIDCIYGNYLKYGPNSDFLQLNSTFNTFYFYIEAKEISYEPNILKYFNELVKPLHHKFKFLSEFIDESLKIELLQKIMIRNISMNLLLYSRVPIQIFTIENNMIIPLKDGVRENLSYLHFHLQYS